MGKIKFKTSRFGELEVFEDRIITIPSGIIGFPEESRYILLDHDFETPFKWLQSIDNPALAFVVVDPMMFKFDYNPRVRIEELKEIEPEGEGDLVVIVLVSIPFGNPSGMTANLQGPLIVNTGNMKGKQVIIMDDRYHTSHKILEEMKKSAKLINKNEAENGIEEFDASQMTGYKSGIQALSVAC